tara:strand:+ start:1072 stop:1758 length:687 start_codon:yes stop_codon:yes gene_type:complete
MNRVQWNEYHEELLINWAQMAKTYSIMHSLCANHYAKIDKLLGIPVIILGAITASSIFGTTNYTENDQIYLNYINGGLALIITVLTGVNKFLGSSEKRIKHQTASFKYTSISMNIDTMLSFSKKNRKKNAQEFIKDQKRKILEIRENCPEVIPKIMCNYINKYDKSIINITTKVNNSDKDNIGIKLKSIKIDNFKKKSNDISFNDISFNDKDNKGMEEACKKLMKVKD